MAWGQGADTHELPFVFLMHQCQWHAGSGFCQLTGMQW
jgi:hypothetical protein